MREDWPSLPSFWSLGHLGQVLLHEYHTPNDCATEALRTYTIVSVWKNEMPQLSFRGRIFTAREGSESNQCRLIFCRNLLGCFASFYCLHWAANGVSSRVTERHWTIIESKLFSAWSSSQFSFLSSSGVQPTSMRDSLGTESVGRCTEVWGKGELELGGVFWVQAKSRQSLKPFRLAGLTWWTLRIIPTGGGGLDWWCKR